MCRLSIEVRGSINPELATKENAQEVSNEIHKVFPGVNISLNYVFQQLTANNTSE